MDYILNQLQKIMAIHSPTGFTRAAAQYTMEEFQRLGYQPHMTNKGCVLVELGGEGSPLLLSAHLDTLGGMVAEVKASGALRITRIGGLDANNIETENCTVFTRDGRQYSGVCQLMNASIHVNMKYDETKRDFDTVEVLLDEKVTSKADTQALGIATGDYVCFDPRTTITQGGYIKSRFLDDKLSVAILLGYAKRLKESGAKLNRKVYAYITVYEEVGHGARASIPEDVVEMIAVDMGCVGDGLACKETQVSICAKDSSGPSNYELTSRLIACAKQNAVDYAVDVYPGYGSDADAALGAGYDITHCVVGAGVYASHGYERTHVDGVKATLNLLEAFTMGK